MARILSAGPMARGASAQRQVSASTKTGIRWMVTRVIRKPTLVCTVSMVPTHLGSDSLITLAENCAELATMEMPKTMARPAKAQGGAPNSKPIPVEMPAPGRWMWRPRR